MRTLDEEQVYQVLHEISGYINRPKIILNVQREHQTHINICIVEAMLLHARILINFFSAKNPRYTDDVNCEDLGFPVAFDSNNNILNIKKILSKRLVHITNDRKIDSDWRDYVLKVLDPLLSKFGIIP